MYIITGKYKNRKILGADSIRSTKSIVRHAIFNIIGQKIINASILDLFGGTGILSLEALSRGARSAIINEINAKHIAIARKNIETICGENEKIKFIKQDAKLLKLNFNQIDIVFSDAPFEQIGINLDIIKTIKTNKGSLKEIIYIAECCKEEMDYLNDSYPEFEVRQYGRSYLKILTI